MMKLPLTTFISSMEMLTKTMQGMLKMADQSIDALVSEVAQTLDDASGSQGDVTRDVTGGAIGDSTAVSRQIPRKEEGKMSDLDLGGDDLKVVRYSILFDKPDEETTLRPEEQDLVDYATDGGSYGGLKIAEFFQKNPQEADKIAEKDRRYVRFVYRVVQRIPKGAANYEKRKVELLKEISGKIG